MTGRWKTEDIIVGAVMETTFWTNPVEESGFRYRATHLDGRRAPKVVLCNDVNVRPGVLCLVRVKAIRKPEREDRGAIEVELVRVQDFKIEGVYLDPVVSKKLQVLLESGLNILLDGPQGCGKTSLARAIAKALGMEFVFFNCGAVVEATDFLATIQVRASESGAPVTDFIKTDMLVAIEQAAQHPEQRFLVFFWTSSTAPRERAQCAHAVALDATRKVFHPIRNTFVAIPDNVQFIAAVNRGQEFSGTFGIDAAQLDRFAPLQMDYLPPAEEVKLLATRHAELSASLLEQVVTVADRIRHAPELSASLSVRATEEACIYLKHPLIEPEQKKLLPEILKSSFCGRFSGRWDDPSSDAGAVWSLIERTLREAAS